ncbi:hypothetical protein [Paractinoplanes maris]|uniref:hypothetical protein n=1 Tax=Paractinoplanes maris TaxID=1734446 RepID=UPI0020221075|nr:hypothetical protein [Actinoplanes maris]
MGIHRDAGGTSPGAEQPAPDEPEYVADPDDPWGYLTRQSTEELTRRAADGDPDPWLKPA